MTFEETYPHYPFSDLVRLGLVAGRGILRAKVWARTTLEHRHVIPTGHVKTAA